MLIMFLVVFIDLLGFGVLIPLLPFYGQHFGASPFVVTMLLSTYSGLQLISAPIWGRLSDRLGRRPVMLISLTTSVLAYLLVSRSESLWMLFAARALQGTSAGNISVAQAYVADVTTADNRAKGMGMLGAAFGLGFIVGPAIGGFLGGASPTAYSVTLPADAAAGLSFLALIVASIFLKESLSLEHRANSKRLSRVAQIADAFSRPRLRLLMCLFFISTFAFAGMETTFALFAYRRLRFGPRAVGEVFAVVGVVLVIMQGGLTGRLTKRFGEPRLLLAGTVTIGLGLFILAFAYVPSTAIIASCILACGMAMAQPSTASLVSREASVLEQGSILGVNQSMGSLARLLGPVTAGAIFTVAGPGAPYLLGACLMAFAAWIATRVIRQYRGEPASLDMTAKEQVMRIPDPARIR